MLAGFLVEGREAQSRVVHLRLQMRKQLRGGGEGKVMAPGAEE